MPDTATTVSVLGVVVGMIGIILAFVFYRQGVRTKSPYWSIVNANLVAGYSDQFKDLKVTYKARPVETISVAKVVVWNQGRETIDRNDLATVNPLRIAAVEGVEILDVVVLAFNNPSNQFSTTLAADGKAALIAFDYLDAGQGGVIQIIHTGVEPSAISILGDVKGVTKITRLSLPQSKRGITGAYTFFAAVTRALHRGDMPRFYSRVLTNVVVFLFGLSCFIVAGALQVQATDYISGFAFIAVLYGAVAWLYIWANFLPSVPDGLNVFGDAIVSASPPSTTSTPPR